MCMSWCSGPLISSLNSLKLYAEHCICVALSGCEMKTGLRLYCLLNPSVLQSLQNRNLILGLILSLWLVCLLLPYEIGFPPLEKMEDYWPKGVVVQTPGSHKHGGQQSNSVTTTKRSVFVGSGWTFTIGVSLSLTLIELTVSGGCSLR